MTLLSSLLVAAFFVLHTWRWLKAEPWKDPEPFDWRPPSDAAKVSFLVPAWNAASDIPEFIEAYSALSYPNKELILVAGGTDGSLNIAEESAIDADILVAEQTRNQRKQGALRDAFARSSGEIIFLTDIDCRPDDESVGRVLAHLVNGNEQVVTGSSRPLATQQSIPAIVVHWATVRKATGFGTRYIDGLLGRSCALTRDAVQASGRFAFNAPTGTDYRLAQELNRQGIKILLEPRSEIITEYAWPLRTYVRKRSRWLRNVLLHAERPRQHAELRGALLTIAVPVGVLGLALVGAASDQGFLLLVAGLVVAHGIVNRVHAVRETLPSERITTSLVWGSTLNLSGTYGAALAAAFTALVPSLRERW